jgi:hypothetical protein
MANFGKIYNKVAAVSSAIDTLRSFGKDDDDSASEENQKLNPSLKSWKSKIMGSGKFGLVRNNLVMIEFMPPKGTDFSDSKSRESVMLLGQQVNIPNMNFNVKEIKRQGFGLTERRVSGIIAPAFTVSFMIDQEGAVLKFFEAWKLAQVQYNAEAGEEGEAGQVGAMLGEVGYYDDYACDANIHVFEPGGEEIWTVKINEAVVTQLADMTMGWGQNDELAQLQVSFSFRTLVSNFTPPATREGSGGKTTLLQFISKYKGAYEIVKSMKKPRNVSDALNVLNNGKTLSRLFD